MLTLPPSELRSVSICCFSACWAESMTDTVIEAFALTLFSALETALETGDKAAMRPVCPFVFRPATTGA